jgi:small-conductance mechanosensitive channel
MTPQNEEVTIPNTIMLSDAATNYSRNAGLGVFAPTSVTIGYDTPWRQVHALLLLAASRTEGVRKDPKPVILQMSLQDFYVQYTLLVTLEHPGRRVFVLDTLHRHIQDAFNEYGVQIMSPRYIGDPAGPKIVPPSLWYAAPATGQNDHSPPSAPMPADGVRLHHT